MNDKLNYGLHPGLRLNINNISLDFRFEKGNSSLITNQANSENIYLRPNQIELGMPLN